MINTIIAEPLKKNPCFTLYNIWCFVQKVVYLSAN